MRGVRMTSGRRDEDGPLVGFGLDALACAARKYAFVSSLGKDDPAGRNGVAGFENGWAHATGDLKTNCPVCDGRGAARSSIGRVGDACLTSAASATAWSRRRDQERGSKGLGIR